MTRGDKVEAVVEVMDAGVGFTDLRVKGNCGPLKGEDEKEYIQGACLVKEGKADVRFIEMMPIGMGKLFSGKSGDEICAMLEKHFGKPKWYTQPLGNGPAVYVQFPGFLKRVGFISAVSHQFCGGCNRVRLTSEGYLKPCLQYGGGTDLRALLRSGASDEVICETMGRVIYEKPACHQFAAEQTKERGSGKTAEAMSLESKGMTRIGG